MNTADGELAAAQYDAMGAVYRAHNDDPTSWNTAYERPAMISLLGEVAGRRVLEVGCGPGALTEWLVNHDALVTAMDVSSEMVRLAAERVGDRAQVVRADLGRPLSFVGDHSVDLVVASLVLHYLRDWVPVLGEFRRVLRPEGAVAFSTHHPSMDWQLYSPQDYFAIKRVNDVWTEGDRSFQVSAWRRPLTAMTEDINSAGFLIDRLIEPRPQPELARIDPAADRKLRTQPAFLFFRLRLAR
ncbi:MAG: class I SAM-dependent methyltransferase [Acidimicrobiaceae bacterium]|nr:class I SAM-dependent methyltransferase [Acidimicrobiaceae bacterium]